MKLQNWSVTGVTVYGYFVAILYFCDETFKE
jgi:hypothetical protein